MRPRLCARSLSRFEIQRQFAGQRQLLRVRESFDHRLHRRLANQQVALDSEVLSREVTGPRTNSYR